MSRNARMSRRLAIAAATGVLLSGPVVIGSVLVPATASAAVDSDGDGLTDEFELRGLTDPQNPDSDRDFLNDGDELHKYYTGPTNQAQRQAVGPRAGPRAASREAQAGRHRR